MQGAESNPVKTLIKEKQDPRRTGLSSQHSFFSDLVEFKMTKKETEFRFECSLTASGSLEVKFVRICFMMTSAVYPFVRICNSVVDHKSIFSINMLS